MEINNYRPGQSLAQISSKAVGHSRSHRPWQRWPKTTWLTAALGILWLGYRIWKPKSHEIIVDVDFSLIKPEPVAAKIEGNSSEVRTTEEGSGPLFHRRYWIDIESPKRTPQQIIQAIGQSPNTFSPTELARFEKTRGAFDTFEVGDEFQIFVSGPWNGPVRVAEVKQTSFIFVTLSDHFESGEIIFSVERIGPSTLRFEIESWARSRDSLVDIIYDKLPVVRFGQTQMWTKFCDAVCLYSGGEPLGPVQIITERERSAS